MLVCAFAAFRTVAVAATPTAAAFAAAAIAFAVCVARFAGLARLTRFGGVFFDVVLEFFLVLDRIVVDKINDRFETRGEFGTRPARGNAHLGALVLALGDHFDRHAITRFDLGQITTLGIEHVDRRFLAGIKRDDVALALGGFVLDHPQRRQPRRRGGADQARTITMRAAAGGRFKHAGAQPLTAHFHQAKARNAANLDACAIVLERVLHRLFDFADV